MAEPLLQSRICQSASSPPPETGCKLLHLVWQSLHEKQALTPTQQRAFKPDHEHDDTITSVGISQPGDLDPARIEAWLSRLLRDQGQDLFRCKGVLSLRGDTRRHVFQGVHMLMDASADREWGDEPRHNTLIFIGRNLDRQALVRSFEACIA